MKLNCCENRMMVKSDQLLCVLTLLCICLVTDSRRKPRIRERATRR